MSHMKYMIDLLSATKWGFYGQFKNLSVSRFKKHLENIMSIKGRVIFIDKKDNRFRLEIEGNILDVEFKEVPTYYKGTEVGTEMFISFNITDLGKVA